MILIHNDHFALYCKTLTHLLSQTKGLMFVPRLPKNRGILFIFDRPQQIDIHMLFVFQSIDAVWIDQQGVILAIRRYLRPFTPFIQGVEATYLLETSAGATASLKVGDKVKLKRA